MDRAVAACMSHVVDAAEPSARNFGSRGLIEIADGLGPQRSSPATFGVDHDSNCLGILVRINILGAWRSVVSGEGDRCRWA
jgi:hypothetical protein